MASISISMTVAGVEDHNPQNITAGAAAPGAGDIELRVDMSKFTSMEQIFFALEKFDVFVENMDLGPKTFKVL